MIHLAIDEEQNQEQRVSEANDCFRPQPFSALCSQLSALSGSCNEDVARLMHIHRQSQGVDE